jgi:hypothetical protein
MLLAATLARPIFGLVIGIGVLRGSKKEAGE